MRDRFIPRIRAAKSESLLDRGIVDSTAILEVISFLEETFAIRVDDAVDTKRPLRPGMSVQATVVTK